MHILRKEESTLVMTKTERIQAAILGKEVDRTPVCFWRHFVGIDRIPEQFVDQMISLQQEYDLDFIKVMPHGLYSVEDYGCEINFDNLGPYQTGYVTRHAIQKPEDWDKITVLPVNDGALGRELKVLELLRKRVKGRIPFIQTVFSPLTTASKMAGERLLPDLREYPEKVHRALGAIAETTRNFVAASLEQGVDGLFFATQEARTDVLSEQEFLDFGKTYDLESLSPIKGSDTYFNVMHLHGLNCMFDQVLDYPVSVLQWHIWQTAPSLEEAAKNTDKAFMGGIVRESLVDGTEEDIEKQLKDTLKMTNGRRIIISPGCAVKLNYKENLLRRMRTLVDQLLT